MQLINFLLCTSNWWKSKYLIDLRYQIYVHRHIINNGITSISNYLKIVSRYVKFINRVDDHAIILMVKLYTCTKNCQCKICSIRSNIFPRFEKIKRSIDFSNHLRAVNSKMYVNESNMIFNHTLLRFLLKKKCPNFCFASSHLCKPYWCVKTPHHKVVLKIR